mgnify:CR=1 FL=1
MNRVLMLACAVAATALVTADVNAAGRLRARSGCGCSQTAPMPVYAAPQPAASCCGGPVVPPGMPGMVMPAAPAVAPGSATPAAPGGHQHHSAAPTESATVAVSAEKTVASCCGKGGSCCGKDKAAALVSADEPKPAVKVADKADAKEAKLEGTLVCAKCGLKDASVKKCTNAIQVKEGDKTVTYYLDDKGNGEDYHEGLCGGGKKEGAKVTGTVAEKDGKKWVKATKVEEKK